MPNDGACMLADTGDWLPGLIVLMLGSCDSSSCWVKLMDCWIVLLGCWSWVLFGHCWSIILKTVELNGVIEDEYEHEGLWCTTGWQCLCWFKDTEHNAVEFADGRWVVLDARLMGLLRRRWTAATKRATASAGVVIVEISTPTPIVCAKGL